MDWIYISYVVMIAGLLGLIWSTWQRRVRFAVYHSIPPHPNKVPKSDELADLKPELAGSPTVGDRGTIAMRIFLTVLVAIAALYGIFLAHDSDPAVKEWSFGAIGTLLGFWLRRD
jgi:hypothetical protein